MESYQLTFTTEDREIERELEESFRASYKGIGGRWQEYEAKFEDEVRREREYHASVLSDSIKVVKAWMAVAVLEAVILGSQAYIWVLFGRKLGATELSIALAIYTWFLVSGMASLVICSAADSYGAYDTIALGSSLLLIVSSFVQGLSVNYVELSVGMVFLALGTSLQPLTIAYIAKMLPHQIAVEYTGYFWALFSVAYLLGPLLGGMIEYFVSYRAVFDFGALLSSVIFGLIVYNSLPSQSTLISRQRTAARLYCLTVVEPDLQFPSALAALPEISRVHRDSVADAQTVRGHCKDPTGGMDFSSFNECASVVGCSTHIEMISERLEMKHADAMAVNVNDEDDQMFATMQPSETEALLIAKSKVSEGIDTGSLTGADPLMTVADEIERSHGIEQTKLSTNVWIYIVVILVQNALVVGTEALMVAFYTVYCYDRFQASILVSTGQIAEFILFFSLSNVYCAQWLRKLDRHQWWYTVVLAGLGSLVWGLIALFIYPNVSHLWVYWIVNPIVGLAYGLVFMSQECEILRLQPRRHSGRISATKEVVRTFARATEGLLAGLLWRSNVDSMWYLMGIIVCFNCLTSVFLALWALGWASVLKNRSNEGSLCVKLFEKMTTVISSLVF